MGMLGGVRKSKSFATPGQFECAMDDREINEKRRKMMEFFTTQTQHTSNINTKEVNVARTLSPKSARKISQPAMHIYSGEGVPMRNATASSTASRAKPAQRSSVTSISDEIIGDEDLKDVDAVFESLLNSTFSESESSSAAAPGSKSGDKNKVIVIEK